MLLTTSECELIEPFLHLHLMLTSYMNCLLLKDYLSLVSELIVLVSYFLPQLMVVFVQLNSNSYL